MSRTIMAVAGLAVALGTVAVVAMAAGGDGEPADLPDPARHSDGPSSDPYVDFRVNPMYDRTATPGMIAESARLTRELAAGDGPPGEGGADVPPSWAERLEEGRAAEAVERERFRARMAAGFPEQSAPIVPPGPGTCSRLCRFIVVDCIGTKDPAQREACSDACLHGDFGNQWRADRILELSSCDHL